MFTYIVLAIMGLIILAALISIVPVVYIFVFLLGMAVGYVGFAFITVTLGYIVAGALYVAAYVVMAVKSAIKSIKSFLKRLF